MKADWDRLGELFNVKDSHAQVIDVDCTKDVNTTMMCKKYDVSGYPTLKYFSNDTSELGLKYEESREYSKLKQFLKNMAERPCDIKSLNNCNKKEKALIQEMRDWDAAKILEQKVAVETKYKAATDKYQELNALFEKQKEEAMDTMKKRDEAKQAMEHTFKSLKYKLHLLEQKDVTVKKDEL